MNRLTSNVSVMRRLHLMTLIAVASFWPFVTLQAQTMPERCVQFPERSQVCPNLLYKRAPVDVAMTDTRAGDIVCICMTDFSELRIPAEGRLEQVDQQVALRRAASKVGLSESELLALLRE